MHAPVTPLWARPPRLLRLQKVRVLIVILVALFLESYCHILKFRVQRPLPDEADRPFQEGCAIPDKDGPRANATILMLARNEDLEGALSAINSLERRFNRWYKYPILFLNDKPWDDDFKEAMVDATSGEVSFDIIPRHMWSFPSWVDAEEAKKSMKQQGDAGIVHAGEESYHHMCRFYSGMFYDMPSLQKYKWYWRIEPDASFTCSITYDPFIEMERAGKKYGYSMALWEVGRTVPSLFRLASEYKRLRNTKSDMWKAMVDASWVPWPMRIFARWLPFRNADGDNWNFCHYWSNFEIADLDFFRSDEYRDFFNFLDNSGGFYFERYGDAPVHSLAAALLLEPTEIHHFEDFGYEHSGLWVQPFNAPDLQFPEVDLGYGRWSEERPGGIGCRCERNETRLRNIQDVCLRTLGDAIK